MFLFAELVAKRRGGVSYGNLEVLSSDANVGNRLDDAFTFNENS
jgi:hypothetical protein